MMREKETILAIDDDASILYLLRRSLEADFYQVLIAADGPTGLDIFNAKPEFDFIGSDYARYGWVYRLQPHS